MNQRLLRLIAGVRNSGRRFPVAILLLLFFMLVFMRFNHMLYDQKEGNTLLMFLLLYTPVAAVISVMLKLWREEVRISAVGWVMCLLAHAAWAMEAMWLVDKDQWHTDDFMLLLGTLALVGVMTCCVSFLRQKTDLQLWNFCMSILAGAALSLCITVVLWLGLVLLLLSVATLFGINVNSRLYVDIAIVCWTVVAPVILLQSLPRGRMKHIGSADGLSPFVDKAAHCILVPLLGLYFLVLYVYMLKILLQWQLPDGMVSTTVSVLTGGTIGMLLLFYPSQFDARRVIDRQLRRWLPVALLPLLVLMSVALWRRMSDYGVTIPRLYMLLFNVWCYGACAYLIVCRRGRLSWLPLSLAVLLFVSSIGPWSFSNIALGRFKSDVVTLLHDTHGPKLPLTKASAVEWSKRLTAKQRDTLYDRMQYLSQNYEWQDVADLMDEDVSSNPYLFYKPSFTDSSGAAVKTEDVVTPQEETEVEAKPDLDINFKNLRHDTISLYGYRFVKYYDRQQFVVARFNKDTIRIYLPDGAEGLVAIKKMKEVTEYSSPLRITTQKGDFVAYAAEYDRQNGSIMLSGVFLFK